MNSHLNENEISDAVLGMSEAEAEQHLHECRACRGQSEMARDLLASFGSEARREAERSQAFWSRQRLLIWSRIDQAARRRTLNLIWGAAAATAATVVLWMTLAQVPSSPVPPTTAHQNDEVLLMQVAVALERGAPEAFAPAEVLTRELNRSAQPKANRISQARGKSEAKPQ